VRRPGGFTGAVVSSDSRRCPTCKVRARTVLALLPAPMGKSLLRSSALRVGQYCGKLALDAFEFRCDSALPQRGIAGALYRRVQGALAFAQ
jgi:hypothetical protein